MRARRAGYWLGLFTSVNLAAQSARDLGDLSLEQLMNESVTSVSKKETKLNQSPAAITVITQEDVRRLGVTSLPEALRLVPGLDVARISNNEWAISSRGFNNEFANKLLVLIDGRTIYTPASGGVFWNAQDVVLDDLDRIEVIRGPGATLWGANAVNGVINIISKSAKETQGGLVSASIGTAEDQPSATVRYGGQIGPDLYYRVYTKYFDRPGFADAAGKTTPDAWDAWRGGFRLDWLPATENTVTLQGDYYASDAEKEVNQISLSPAGVAPIDPVSHNAGNNVLGRWAHPFSPDSALTVQAYYDRVKQGDGFGTEYRETFDLDLQHQWVLGERESIVWGAGYRDTALTHTPSFNLTWTPQFERLRMFNLFGQDEVTLVPDRLYFTLGSKFEHNNLTGWEIQPSARLLWTPTERQTVWSAVSSATRTPAVFERDARLNVAAFQAPGGPPVLVSLAGNTDVDVENLTAYEVGYRITPTSRLSLDLTGFFNSYNNLLGLVANPTRFEAEPATPHVLVSSTYQNSENAETYGTEFSAQWQVAKSWRVAGGYTWLKMHASPDRSVEGASPQQQFQVRTYFEGWKNWELNAAAYYVGRVEAQSGDTTALIRSYVRFDLGLSWRPTPAIEVGLWGQNLLDKRHTEFASQESTLLTGIPRSVTTRVTWHF